MPDFGCYINVNNQMANGLILASQNVVDGHWVSSPPDSINPSANPQLHVADSFGPYGSEAYVTYTLNVPSGPSVTIHMACPTGSSNILTANSSDPRIMSVSVTPAPQSGHPINGTVTISKPAFEAADLWSEADKNDEIVKKFIASPIPTLHQYDELARYLVQAKEKSADTPSGAK
ncbi:hypothetical protein MMC27_008791 [Xylographa pallens]|nr:hypothetical protein [Xylographa pallens]